MIASLNFGLFPFLKVFPQAKCFRFHHEPVSILHHRFHKREVLRIEPLRDYKMELSRDLNVR